MATRNGRNLLNKTYTLLCSGFLLLSGWATQVQATESEAFLAFDKLLKTEVVDGQVNYPAFANNAGFQSYIREIERTRADSFTDNSERIAYLINAYNALTIDSILQGRSPASLLGRLRFFKTSKVRIGNEDISLYDLERDRILTEGEPRVHFALVCASASCPPLRSEAYRAEKLDSQLDDQARGFINDSSKNSFDKSAKRAKVSKIFKWYRSDFEEGQSDLGDYLSQYVADADLARALRDDRFKFKYNAYDWSLNGTRR